MNHVLVFEHDHDARCLERDQSRQLVCLCVRFWDRHCQFEFGLAQAMSGLITSSSSSSLAAGSSETISVSNSRITPSTATAVLVTVQSRCSSGYAQVASVAPSSGSASIVVVHLGTAACSSTSPSMESHEGGHKGVQFKFHEEHGWEQRCSQMEAEDARQSSVWDDAGSF